MSLICVSYLPNLFITPILRFVLRYHLSRIPLVRYANFDCIRSEISIYRCLK